MKFNQFSLDDNCSINDALDYFKKNNLTNVIVISSSQKPLGLLTEENLLKAAKFHLHSYPVSLLLNYYEHEPQPKIPPTTECVRNKIKLLLPESIQEAIHICSKFAQQKNKPIYLVGGLVRDLIRNDTSLDMDITLESSGIEFAYELASESKLVNFKEQHPDFGTAKISINTGSGHVEIDIASTRQEFYSKPGALPTIEEFNCPLKYDLSRRDFTVNAMAISVSEDTFGELIDVCCGLDDIDKKLLRVIHSFSFIDDPTRIIRGIKFAVRFGYIFSLATENLIRACISSGIFDNFCTERLKLELKSALNLNNVKVIQFIENFQLFKLLDNTIIWDKSFPGFFENLHNNINSFTNYLNPNFVWLIYLASILSKLPESRITKVLENLYLASDEKTIVIKGIKLIYNARESSTPVKASQIYNFYNGYPVESIIISTFGEFNSEINNNIKLYLDNYSKITIFSNGETLQKLGLKPGPQFSVILKTLLDQKLDGKLNTPDDEIEFVKNHYL